MFKNWKLTKTTIIIYMYIIKKFKMYYDIVTEILKIIFIQEYICKSMKQNNSPEIDSYLDV